MFADETPDTPDAPDTDSVTSHLDAESLKQAHGRTGRLLKTAGLPFEDEEFDEPGLGTVPPESRGEDPAEDPETA